ncbi:phosphotransferase [Amycolatopsis sp. OK19-0408]|uniref:Phosphotransferase n=1 Tax=Amycolatopsis iheyensis TaxID=2945988 RepID=A0A9X2SHW8_9PSEU|nr:phosphotransferase [Amycolatopsis iheyensis]MCR6482829.1 phosphotransferase [Amycolatopsis iheyensis]
MNQGLARATSPCDHPPVPARERVVDPDHLARWCLDHLGSSPVEELFSSGHLSVVLGLRLADGRAVVVKVRPRSPRVAACVDVQRRLFQAGYPCPRPLTDALAFGDDVATAETYVPGGAALPGADRAASVFAEAFARLIRLAPRPAEVSTLDPAPSWADWDQGEDRLWPTPEERALDLDAVPGAEWIDEAGRRARDRLRAGGSDPVIGHCDWLAGNLRWSSDDLLVVHDWDSVITESEAVLVGFAAALYSTVDPDRSATVEDTERFLAAYGRARGRPLDTDERERSWAAGVWTRAYDAKFQHAAGHPVLSLSEVDARERLRRAHA